MGIDVKELKIAKIVIFCIMLFGSASLSLLLPEKEYSVVENRELAQKPDFTRKKFLKGTYQTQYEDYLSDQMYLRENCVSLAVMIQRILGKQDINGVYLGREGYLLEKSGESDFDAAQVQENVTFLSTFLNEAAEEYGEGHVSCLMIPSKTYVMSEYLPAFAQTPVRSEVTRQLQQKVLDKDIVLDLGSELKKHQKEYIYYRTDHHWTTLGAYYAYTAWADAKEQAAVKEKGHYQRETVFEDFYGTTYNKIHVKVPADSVELFHVPHEDEVLVEMDDSGVKLETMYFPKEALQGFNRYNVFLSKNTFKIEIQTKAETGKTLLLIKDSFANCFVPFLTEDYERIIMIDYRYGKTPIGEIMSAYEDITDVLVMFQTEKFMQNTKLGKLADTKRKSKTMEAFNPEDFF